MPRVVLVGVVFAVFAGLGTAHPEPPRSIVYASNWTPHFRTSEIYVVGAGGGRIRDLTNNEIDDVDPALSPDARKIVFARRRNGAFDLYTMDADGSGVVRITNRAGSERHPAWAPDGTKIAFTAPGGIVNDHGYALDQVFTVNPDGSGLRQLTADADGITEPAWSPDGTKIAAVGESGGIVTIDRDGSHVTAIDPRVGDEADYDPAWSPDGRRIAFTAGVASLNTSDVWVMDADGRNARRLARFGSQPAWSPDGKAIAFVNGPVVKCDPEGCYDEGRTAIATVDARGGPRHFVTRPMWAMNGSVVPTSARWFGEGASFFGLAWLPGGRRIVYARRLEQRPTDLFAIGPSGGRQRRLTGVSKGDFAPSVAPNGRVVAFLRPRPGRQFPDLYTVRRDGTGARRVARDAHGQEWSRNGRRLAFTRSAIHRNQVMDTVYTANADGSGKQRIGPGSSATWSPDGRRIAYLRPLRRGSSPSTAVVVAGADGRHARVSFVVSRRAVYGLEWSPVRDELAFTSSSLGQLGRGYSSRIEVLPAAGGPVRRLTSRRDDFAPVWSPDGSTIAFERGNNKPDEYSTTVCVVRRTGGARCLDRFAAGALDAAWSPTGSRLVFASRRDGDYELYTINPDGTGRRQLTHNTADDANPSW